jgi:hypothetical protein
MPCVYTAYSIYYTIGDSSYRLNFDLGKKDKIHHHSLKEYAKISKTAKSDCDML